MWGNGNQNGNNINGWNRRALNGQDQWDQWWNQQNQQGNQVDQQRNQGNQQRNQVDQWWNQVDQRNQQRNQVDQRNQWWNQRTQPRNQQNHHYDEDWERLYLTGRNLRSIVILVDQGGEIYILVNRRLLAVQTDSRGRIRINRDRRGRVWILVRHVEPRDHRDLRSWNQASLADLAQANGIHQDW